MAVQRQPLLGTRLLGNAASSDLYDISHAQPQQAQPSSKLSHDYLKIWSLNPDSVKAADITKAYPGIRTVTWKTSGLFATYGESNALTEGCVANARQMDDAAAGHVFPILQAVRQERATAM